MESIFAISFWIIDNNITSEGTALFVHEMGSNHSRNPSTSLSQAFACRAERDGVWVTRFVNQEQLSPSMGGTALVQMTEGGSQNRCLHASFPKHLFHWAEHSQRTLYVNLELVPSRTQPQQLEHWIPVKAWVRCSETPGWLTALFLVCVLASLHLCCWKRKWNSQFSCIHWTTLKSPPAVEKWSRAVRSGAGFLPKSQAGCWIHSCSLVWQRASSNTTVLICFHVGWIFVCHFPIHHHITLYQRLKSLQLSEEWWHKLQSCSVSFAVTWFIFLTLESKSGP